MSFGVFDMEMNSSSESSTNAAPIHSAISASVASSLGQVTTEYVIESEIDAVGSSSNAESTDEAEIEGTWRYVESPCHRVMQGRKNLEHFFPQNAIRTVQDNMNASKNEKNPLFNLNHCNIAIMEHEQKELQLEQDRMRHHLNNDVHIQDDISVHHGGILVPAARPALNGDELLSGGYSHEDRAIPLQVLGSSLGKLHCDGNFDTLITRNRSNSRSLSPGMLPTLSHTHGNTHRSNSKVASYQFRNQRRVSLDPSLDDTSDEDDDNNPGPRTERERESRSSGSSAMKSAETSDFTTVVAVDDWPLHDHSDLCTTSSSRVVQVPLDLGCPCVVTKKDKPAKPFRASPFRFRAVRRRSSGSTSGLSTGSNTSGNKTPPMVIPSAMINISINAMESENFETSLDGKLDPTSVPADLNFHMSTNAQAGEQQERESVLSGLFQKVNQANPYAPPAFYSESVDSVGELMVNALNSMSSQQQSEKERKYENERNERTRSSSRGDTIDNIGILIGTTIEVEREIAPQPTGLDMLNRTELEMKSQFRPISGTNRLMCPSTDADEDSGMNSGSFSFSNSKVGVISNNKLNKLKTNSKTSLGLTSPNRLGHGNGNRSNLKSARSQDTSPRSTKSQVFSSTSTESDSDSNSNSEFSCDDGDSDYETSETETETETEGGTKADNRPFGQGFSVPPLWEGNLEVNPLNLDRMNMNMNTGLGSQSNTARGIDARAAITNMAKTMAGGLKRYPLYDSSRCSMLSTTRLPQAFPTLGISPLEMSGRQVGQKEATWGNMEANPHPTAHQVTSPKLSHVSPREASAGLRVLSPRVGSATVAHFSVAPSHTLSEEPYRASASTNNSNGNNGNNGNNPPLYTKRASWLAETAQREETQSSQMGRMGPNWPNLPPPVMQTLVGHDYQQHGQMNMNTGLLGVGQASNKSKSKSLLEDELADSVGLGLTGMLGNVVPSVLLPGARPNTHTVSQISQAEHPHLFPGVPKRSPEANSKKSSGHGHKFRRGSSRAVSIDSVSFMGEIEL